MRAIRIQLGTVGLLALLGAAGACAQPKAANAAGVWVEVTPGTVAAGSFVALRATCGNNTNPATVTSKVFGTVTLRPFSNMLTAEVEIPSHAKEGGYQITLTCRGGSTATTTLWVINKASATPTPRPSMGPHTGGGFLANRGRTFAGADAWLIGGAGALAAASILGLTTVRRRRRHRAAGH